MAVMIVPGVCLWMGYGLFQCLSPRSFRLDLAGGLFVFGLTGALALGWLGLVAAEVGVFSAVALVASGLAVGTAGWLAQRRRGARVTLDRADTPRVEIVFLIGLIVLMAMLYMRPHEFIFGGADAGVYVNLGAQLARSGRWLIHNPDLAALPPADYAMFFREHPPDLRPQYYYLPGFYVSDAGAATILPQFYPLHVIWLAFAQGVGGLAANLSMTPLWGMLGVLAFYLAVREAFDRQVAAVGAVLLALTPTQVWFARYPTAEVLTQFLLFSGLYAFARYARHGEKWSAVLAGLALGQVMLARIDTYFLVGIPIGYAVYLRLRRKLDRRFWFFAAPMLAMAAHSLVHGVWQAWPYLYNTFLVGGTLTPVRLAAMACGLLGGVAAFLAVDRWVGRNPAWAARVDPVWRGARLVLSVGLVLLALYAYFGLPLTSDPNRQSPYWYGQNTIPDVEPFNFVRLGWYLSPLGLALGALGLADVVRRDISERTWLITGVGLFFSILFLYRTFNNPHHVYVMRRYVPAAIPAFALGAAYVARRLAQWRPAGRSVGYIIAMGLVTLQIGWMTFNGRLMFYEVDYGGGVEQFERLAQAIPPDAVVVFNQNQPVGAGEMYGTPLAYLQGYTVLSLQGAQFDQSRWDALVQDWLSAARPVIVIDTATRAAGLCDRWQCAHLGSVEFSLPILEMVYDHFPRAVHLVQDRLEIYRVSAVRP
jgi:4-amino-4-deoxy-L-arabinose transferase-like glycosyltransferase